MNRGSQARSPLRDGGKTGLETAKSSVLRKFYGTYDASEASSSGRIVSDPDGRRLRLLKCICQKLAELELEGGTNLEPIS